MHSYMAWVFGELLTDSSTLADDFVIRSMLPPYASVHYLIVFLQKIFSPFRAEQLLLCVYVVVVVFGFRHFARTLFGTHSSATLLVFVFIFHTVLFRGMYNFSIGVGLFFWAGAFWVGAGRTRGVANPAAFVVTMILMAITHPVMPLFFAGFLGLYLAWWVAAEAMAGGGLRAGVAGLLKKHRLRCSLFLLCLIPTAWSMSFVKSGGASELSLNTDFGERLVRLSQFHQLMPYMSPKPWALMAVAVASVLFLVCLAAWQQRGPSANRSFWPAVMCGLGLLAVYMLIPTAFAGSRVAPVRFPPFAFLMLAAAACQARIAIPLKGLIPLRAGAVMLVFGTLLGLYVNTKLMAEIPVALSAAPAVRPGARAFILAAEEATDKARPRGARFSPCMWGPAYYFQRTEAVHQNFNWLGKPQLVLDYRNDLLYHKPQQWELSKYIFADPDEPVPELPPQADVVVSYQCRSGDGSLPPGETITARYGLEKVWTGNSLTIYAKPSSLAEEQALSKRVWDR